MTTIATYVHVQNSLATTKIEYLFSIFYKKNALLIDSRDHSKKTRSSQLLMDNPNDAKYDLVGTKKLLYGLVNV